MSSHAASASEDDKTCESVPLAPERRNKHVHVHVANAARRIEGNFTRLMAQNPQRLLSHLPRPSRPRSGRRRPRNRATMYPSDQENEPVKPHERNKTPENCNEDLDSTSPTHLSYTHVNSELSLLVTTWNMNGCAAPSIGELQAWIPLGCDLYVIFLQESRTLEVLQARVRARLEGGNPSPASSFHVYMWPRPKKNRTAKPTSFVSGTLGSGTGLGFNASSSPSSSSSSSSATSSGSTPSMGMLVLVRAALVKTGVFRETQLQSHVRHDVVRNQLLKLGGAKNSAALAMHFTFHDTILSFVDCRLANESNWPSSVETRAQELKEIFERVGISHNCHFHSNSHSHSHGGFAGQSHFDAEVTDASGASTNTRTVVLPHAHHVFLGGDLGVRSSSQSNSKMKGIMQFFGMGGGGGGSFGSGGGGSGALNASGKKGSIQHLPLQKKTSTGATAAGGGVGMSKALSLLGQDEVKEMKKHSKVFGRFRELPIAHPPTTPRVVRRNRKSESLCLSLGENEVIDETVERRQRRRERGRRRRQGLSSTKSESHDTGSDSDVGVYCMNQSRSASQSIEYPTNQSAKHSVDQSTNETHTETERERLNGNNHNSTSSSFSHMRTARKKEKPKQSAFSKHKFSDPNHPRSEDSNSNSNGRSSRNRSLFRRRTAHIQGTIPIPLQKEEEEVEEEGDDDEEDIRNKSLFELGTHGNLIPSYSDRVMWLSRPAHQHLLQPLSGGSCEGIRSSTHVPVFIHFSVVGKDVSLLTSWERLSGNRPIRLASRVTEHMTNHVAAAGTDTDPHAVAIHLQENTTTTA